MDLEQDKRHHGGCNNSGQISIIDGHVQVGRNFEAEISLPEDNRDSIYGIIKDRHGRAVEDAVVKLVEIRRGERRPVSHTFTNAAGEFVFGPLCPTRQYEILFWASELDNKKNHLISGNKSIYQLS